MDTNNTSTIYTDRLHKGEQAARLCIGDFNIEGWVGVAELSDKFVITDYATVRRKATAVIAGSCFEEKLEMPMTSDPNLVLERWVKELF